MSNQNIPKTEEEWKVKLTDEQYEVMRNKGTELPYTGEYLFTKKQGTYHCAGCNTPLFHSESKYDFGSGWPTFGAPLDEESISYEKDTVLGAEHTAFSCKTCGCRIGHIFDGGPESKGENRYTVNSCALVFEKDKK